VKGRFRVREFAHERPYFAASIESLSETNTTGPQIDARAEVLKTRAIEALSLLPQFPANWRGRFSLIDSPSRLADLIISFMDVKAQKSRRCWRRWTCRSAWTRCSSCWPTGSSPEDHSRHHRADAVCIGRASARPCCVSNLRQLQKSWGTTGTPASKLTSWRVDREGLPCRPKWPSDARKELKRCRRMNEASRSMGWCEAISTGSLRFRGRLLNVEDIDMSERVAFLTEDHYGSTR